MQREFIGFEAIWTLTASEPGTRRLGKYGEIYQPGNRYRFMGRPVLDLGKITFQDTGRNIVVTDGLEFIGDMLIDTSAVYDTGLTYCAEGTENTAVAASDAALGTEAARKAITSRSRSGVVITLSTFFTAGEANDAIEEAGVFGGSGAGAGADSGVLFSHWLVSYDNSGTTSDITFDYVLTPAYS